MKICDICFNKSDFYIGNLLEDKIYKVIFDNVEKTKKKTNLSRYPSDDLFELLKGRSPLLKGRLFINQLFR